MQHGPRKAWRTSVIPCDFNVLITYTVRRNLDRCRRPFLAACRHSGREVHRGQARETSNMPTYKHRKAVWAAPTRLAILLGLASCGGNTEPPPPLTYGDTGVLDAGYTGTGFASFDQSLDPQFRYLYFNSSLAEGPWTCA